MIRGREVVLAPLREEDLPLLFEWINDRDEVLSNARYKPVHETDHRAWFETVRQRDDVVVFGIRLSDGDRLIGSCQLLDIEPFHGTAELQIRIGECGERGRGRGAEAVRLLLRHAFVDLGLARVQLHAFATNEAALRCYEKVGFRREGLLRQAARIDGVAVDVVVMGILHEELADGDRA